MNYTLASKDELTKLVKSNGINSWNELTEFVKGLPYGRNQNRFDLGLVLTERKGSCSSKHALLKKIADFNNIPNVKLFLGIYKMNQSNTPKIGNELEKYSIEFIPEAHCYLEINETRLDFTADQSEFEKIQNEIIEEKEIETGQVAEFKVEYHKNHIKKWLIETNSEFSFDQFWNVREKCIENLTE
ncbi:MAG: hypothetical protein ABJK11_16035 [Balneola sp.]